MQRKDLSSCKARGEIDPETQIKAVSTLNLSAPFLYQHWYKHLQNWLSAALLPALAVAGVPCTSLLQRGNVQMAALVPFFRRFKICTEFPRGV